MPSLEPPQRPDEIPVEHLDVLGHRERGHLSHVGFARVAAEVSWGNEVPIIDARPVRRTNDVLAVHAIGRLQLGRRERASMTTWLERQARSRPLSGDYLSRHDPSGVERDGVSGRIVSQPQSCAGLVYECLRVCAGVELVDLHSLPWTTRERLVELWGEKVVRVAEYRDDLVGEGPWAVLLPAHILHALARADPRAGPLRPTADHWDFP